MNRIIDNKYPILIAFIQWFFTTIFQIDRCFFTYDQDTALFIVVKLLYLIMLGISWCFLFHVARRLRTRDQRYQRGVSVFCFYMSIMMILMVILWPGTWAWDDLGVLEDNLRWYNWAPWQHIITSIYQMVFLQILPFPGGIILLQNIIASICVAFVVVKLEQNFKLTKLKYGILDNLIKVAPFLLPPVLMYQFSGYRIGLYVYLEVVVLVILVCAIKDQYEWSNAYLILFCTLCVFIATWRTESLFYIPCSCLGILLLKKKVLPNNKKSMCFCILIIGFIIVNAIQNRALGNSNYEVVSILRPCVEVIRAADKNSDKELLEEISKVIDINVVYDNPEENGEMLYWNYGVVKNEYSKDEYKACLKSFMKLCLKYPQVVMAERLSIFIWSSGINGTTVTNVDAAATLFDPAEEKSKAEIFQNADWVANKPVFPSLRKELIYALGLKKEDGTIYAMNRIIWNMLIPLVILLYGWIKFFIKKQWYWLLILTAVLIRVPIIILTQPAGWFMYWLSIYMLGYVFSIYKFLEYKVRIKEKERYEDSI